MGRVASKTIHSYLTMIYSIYINHVLPVIVFKNISLYYILDGATSFNPSLKEAILKLLILYTILAKIVTNSNLTLEVNTDTAFCLAFIGCLYIGKISYTDKQWSKPSFAVTKATHSDVQFSPFKDHLTFHFKQSKTNKDKQGI
jgi:hypothetical protein